MQGQAAAAKLFIFRALLKMSGEAAGENLSIYLTNANSRKFFPKPQIPILDPQGLG